eukprot:jgi/Chrzof1/3656/Cz13g03290.t1
MSRKQTVVLVDHFANDKYLDHVKVVQQDVPEPKDGEVLVQVLLRPIHPADHMTMQNGFGGALPLPLIPGSEGVGKVAQLGSKFVVPDDVDDISAAQIWANPSTAYGILQELNIPPGGYLIQTAATSVVGHNLITLAKHFGIKTINMVRKESAVEELKRIGADEVLVVGKDDIVERVKHITGGQGAAGAADAVDGPGLADVVASLGQGGKLILYGALDDRPSQFSHFDLMMGAKSIHAFALVAWLAQQGPGYNQTVMANMFKLLQQGAISIGKADHTFPLEDVKEALVASTQRAQGYKTFLEG